MLESPSHVLVWMPIYESEYGPCPRVVSVDVLGHKSAVVFSSIDRAEVYLQSLESQMTQIASFEDIADLADFLQANSKVGQYTQICIDPIAGAAGLSQTVSLDELASRTEVQSCLDDYDR